MRSGLRLPAAVVAFACVAAVGCTTDDDGGDTTAAAVVTTTTVAPAAPASDDCRNLPPTASYPPLVSLPAPNQMPTGSKLREIQDRGKLTVGVSADTLLAVLRR